MEARNKATSKPKSPKNSSTQTNDPDSMEQFIHEHQTILSAAEEVAKMGSWKWDLRTQKVTWSDGMFRLFGVEREGFDGDMNRVIAERIHPDDIAAVNESNRSVVQEAAPIPMAYRIVLPDGTERTVWAQGKLIRDETGQPTALTGFVQDITERVRAEKKVLQMKRLYATLSQVNQMIVRVKGRDELYQTICDVAVKYGEFTIAWISLLDEESGDMRPAAATGLDIHDWPFPIVNIRQGLYQNALVPIAVRTSKVTTSENVLYDSRTQNFGNRFEMYKINAVAAIPFRLRGKTIGIVGLISHDTGIFNDKEEINLLEEMGLDISFALDNMENEKERQQAEEMIHQSEEKFRHLVEHLHAGLVIHAPDTSILFNNPQASRILHLSPEQMRGKVAMDPVWAFIREDGTTMPLNEYPVEQVISSGKPLENFVVGINFADQQEPAWVLVNAYPEFDASGRLLQIVVTFVEITERKQAEDRLRENEERLRLSLQAAHQGLFDLNVQTGNAVINREYAEMLGYDFETFVETNAFWIERLHPDDQASTAKAYSDYIAGTLPEYRVVFRQRTRDGKWKWILSLGKIIEYDAQGKPLRMAGTHTDITERIMQEEALRLSEAAYQGYFNMGSIGVCVTSPDKGWIEVNARLCEMLGYSKDELKGMTWAELTHPDDLAADTELFNETVAGQRESYQLEKRFLHKNGNVISTLLYVSCQRHDDGTVRYFLASLLDITERKEAEKKLRDSEERYRLISENSADVIWVLDPIAGRFTYVSPSVEKLRGYTPAEVMAQPVSEALTPESLKIVSEGLAERLPIFIARGTGTEAFVNEVDQPCKDGSIVHTEVTTTYMFNQQGQVEIIGISRDITERKKVENILRESEARFSKIFQSSPTGINIFDLGNGSSVDANDAFLEIVGYSREEILSHTAAEMDLFVDIEARNKWMGLLKNGQFVRNQDAKIRRKSGEIRDVLASLDLIELNGRTMVLVIASDITERKKAEDALTHSHDLMSYIIEHNRSAIAVHDRDMKYIYVSQSYLDDYKIKQNVIGKHHYDVFPDLPQKWRDVHQRVLKGEVLSAEDDIFERADGSIEWTRWECRPWFEVDGSIGGLIVYTESITDRKKAEEALRRNEHVLRLFVEHSPASIAMFDRDMRYIVASRRYLIDYELPPQDLTGRSHYDVFPEIPQRWKEIHRRCLQGNTEMAEDDPFPRSNGKMDWVRWEIRPWYEEPEKIGGIILFSEVITDRKLAQQALRESDERYRLISSLISDYVYSGIRRPDGTIQAEWVSGAFDQITGYSIEEVNQLPYGFASLVLPSDLPAVRERQGHIVEGGSAPIEYRICRKDGQIRWLLDYIHDVPHAEQRNRIIGAVQDITQRKQAEEALYKLNAELEQRVLDRTLELSQANRAKDEFLANMSHELRTPLNTVLGLSETLLEQRSGLLNKKQSQSLELISSSGRHLLSLINDILEVSKIEAGKLDLHPVIVSVKELCESSLNFIRQMALKKRITLQFNHEATVARVYADPQRLKQILINLLMNAVKFTPEHGKVTLDVYSNAEQDQIMFAISDTGIGIKEDDLTKLFTPFTQLDSSLARQYAGTGLGLALVHKLTDLHGGSVHVESEQGKGSRFTVILPLPQNIHELIASERPAFPADPQPSIASSPTAQGHILLAEDNEINAGMLAEYLIANGYSVATAQNGEEALQKAEEIDPCVILMDIQMPKMDGLEAMRRLRANPRFASTPIIALTALAMPGDKERCFEAGANEYMSKPVSLRKVVQLIKKLTEPAE